MNTITKLKARLEKATPGPWTRWNNEAHSGDCTVHSPGHLSVRSGRKVFECDDEIGDREQEACRDAALIVDAINTLPTLLDVAEQLRDILRKIDAEKLPRGGVAYHMPGLRECNLALAIDALAKLEGA